MEYIYVGDVVNTHGLKGEVRLVSNFEYKKRIFKKNFKLYIGRSKEEVIINTYRVHKDYDMLTFVNLNSIDDVIIYKGDKVYINRADLKIKGYFNEDLIGLEVYSLDKYLGKVEYIMKNKAHNILVVTEGEKKHLIPNIPEFVTKIDLDNHRIEIKEIEGLIDEDWRFNAFSGNVYRILKLFNYKKSNWK